MKYECFLQMRRRLTPALLSLACALSAMGEDLLDSVLEDSSHGVSKTRAVRTSEASDSLMSGNTASEDMSFLRKESAALREEQGRSTNQTVTDMFDTPVSLREKPNLIEHLSDFRLGGLLGLLSGTDLDSGLSAHVEADWSIREWPILLSVRGKWSQISGGSSSDYSKDVYGRHGYSYREYFYDYGDLKGSQIGGSAVIHWTPFREKPFRPCFGVGGVFVQTKCESTVTETIVDHHSYGRHWRSGGYSHSYFRTSRSVKHYSDDDSESQSAPLLKVGVSWALNAAISLEAEFSHMPNLYEDSSENELRFAGSMALSSRASFDAAFEYLTEAETYFVGIGYSLRFR